MRLLLQNVKGLTFFGTHGRKIDAAGELSSRIDRLEAEHRQHELRDEITRTLKHSGLEQGSKDRLQLQTLVLAPWVLDKGYGPQFDDLDGISRHFATTASDSDYDIDDINVFIESVHPINSLITLSMNTRYTNFLLL